MLIADAIKQVKRESGLSSTAIAKVLSCSTTLVTKYEKGRVKAPHRKTAIKFYSVFGIIISPYSAEDLVKR